MKAPLKKQSTRPAPATAAAASPVPDRIVLTYKTQLRLTRRQYRAFEAILEQQRLLYNAALEERIGAYDKAGLTITEAQQSKSLTVIRSEDPAFARVQRRIRARSR